MRCRPYGGRTQAPARRHRIGRRSSRLHGGRARRRPRATGRLAPACWRASSVGRGSEQSACAQDSSKKPRRLVPGLSLCVEITKRKRRHLARFFSERVDLHQVRRWPPTAPESVLIQHPTTKSESAKFWQKRPLSPCEFRAASAGDGRRSKCGPDCVGVCGGVRSGPRAFRGKGGFDCIPPITDNFDSEIC